MDLHGHYRLNLEEILLKCTQALYSTHHLRDTPTVSWYITRLAIKSSDMILHARICLDKTSCFKNVYRNFERQSY